MQAHALDNGILFRADVHKVRGFGTTQSCPTGVMTFEVCRRIKEE